MKRFLIAAAVAAATVATPALAADVGVSVSIGQPGFYGQLDIGGYPQPQVIYRQPRVIERVPMDRPPVYLRVPPGHAKNWRKHCRKYNACGERVFFVQSAQPGFGRNAVSPQAAPLRPAGLGRGDQAIGGGTTE